MKGKITRFGIDGRDQIVGFQHKFYNKNAPSAPHDSAMTSQTLGKNWSCFLYERDGKNFLVFFDVDDGSGGTPFDCKLVWPKFQDLILRHNVTDYMVFKIQHSSVHEQSMYYPFKSDVYPFALFTNEHDKIFRIADALPKVKQDIDVLFVGGMAHAHNHPYCWPKERNTNQHWPTNKLIGYRKLLDIKKRRSDLNIVALDDRLPSKEFFDIINRSKVCIDFPGVGLSTRKLYELLVLGKCTIALKQHNCCWPLEEWEHYASLGQDYDYVTLEHAINRLIESQGLRSHMEQKAASLRPLMTHEAVGEYTERIVDEFVDACLDGTIEGNRVKYG